MYSQGMYFEGLEKVLVEIDRADPHPVVRKYPSDYFYTITRIAPPVCEADKEPISTQFLPPEQAKQWRDSVCPERGLSERGRGSLIESGQIPSMRYLSPKQAKQWLDDICPGHGLSESGLNFLIESGQIPSIAVSPKKRLINVMQIERYLAGKPGNPFS